MNQTEKKTIQRINALEKLLGEQITLLKQEQYDFDIRVSKLEEKLSLNQQG